MDIILIAQDTFTAPDFTLLKDHVPNLGLAWNITELDIFQETMIISNALHQTITGPRRIKNVTPITTPDMASVMTLQGAGAITITLVTAIGNDVVTFDGTDFYINGDVAHKSPYFSGGIYKVERLNGKINVYEGVTLKLTANSLRYASLVTGVQYDYQGVDNAIDAFNLYSYKINHGIWGRGVGAGLIA